MAFFGRIAYRDPKWNLWLNYLDVQENFNAEAGFVQRTRHPHHQGPLRPDAAPKTGNIKLFEPMYVLTYTTDQTNRLVGRQHHLMLGTTLRDDTFINVIYQKNLDVLDVPFRIRPNVTIPVGSLQHERVDVHLQHQPGTTLLSAGHVPPVEFYGGIAQVVLVRRRRARVEPALDGAAIQPQRREDAVGRFPGEPVDAARRLHVLAADDGPQPDAVQHATHEISNNVRFNFIHRPGSDIYVVYNDLSQTGLPADIFGRRIASWS